jgi:hypothetical protein
MFRAIKAAVLLTASLLLVWVSARDIWIAQTETAPAEFTVAQLVASHKGQQWLKVTGRLRLDAMHVRYGKVSVQEPSSNYRVWVPLIGVDEDDQAPIHVLVNFGPFRTERDLDAWKAKLPGQKMHTITGLAPPLGGPRYQEMFPQLRFAEPLFFVNEGGRPRKTGWHYFLLGLGLLLVLLSGRWLYLWHRGR